MADASATCPAAPDIRDTFGIFVLGTIIGTLFYGMTLLQTGMYFGRRVMDEDNLKTTALVTLLWALDSLAWVLEVYTTWWYFVVNFGSVAALEIPVWTLKLEPGLTYTVAFIAQIFFIEKIWLLSRSNLLGMFMTLLSVAAWVLGLAITGIVFEINSLVSPTIDKVNIGQKTLSTIIEVIIAIAMCYLFKSRQQGIASTDNILNRLILFALSRGLVLVTTQILYTIVVRLFRHTSPVFSP
ncbi:hypothetical protein OF83DRAFT_442467 [Amylostereum chailletii]|nr:hypothetical protein OF83DRAFT_442467 [Amylostereum chailletii]